jgi:hypothetical protein
MRNDKNLKKVSQEERQKIKEVIDRGYKHLFFKRTKPIKLDDYIRQTRGKKAK